MHSASRSQAGPPALVPHVSVSGKGATRHSGITEHQGTLRHPQPRCPHCLVAIPGKTDRQAQIRCPFTSPLRSVS